MGRKNLSAVIAVVRQRLRDEFVFGAEFEWEDDELSLLTNDCLAEISECSPYQVKETFYIVAKSGTATATTPNHLVDTTESQFVAGDVGKTVYNTTDETTAKITVYNSASDVTLDTDIMASGESYEIHCGDGTSPRDINIADIEDLLYVDKAEYPTRQNPQVFRNVEVFGDILTLDISSTPTDGDEVFLYCAKTHQLTEASSTLNPKEERLLILGVVGQAAINKARSLINKINIGGARTPADMEAWGIAQLTLYRQGLSELVQVRISIDYRRN
jgi:uncharacterized protein YqfB (UPF0267 family)